MDSLVQHRSHLEIGFTLANRYHIISRLGEGGMGAVFLANDLKLSGKQWAVKESLLHSHHAQGFVDEAAILVQLDHPFLPKIVDFFPPDANGYSYLVIDYIKGQSLQKLFSVNRAIPLEQIVKYAYQLCQVFDYLHHFKPKAIIYRDLKPSNVMIDEQNNIRLIDFGIARSYSSERHSDTMQLGTVGFAAPEQYEHQQTDPRTDLYTLGALMYYLLSGGHYYSPQLEKWQPFSEQVPEKLNNLIDKLLQNDPINRYQTAVEVQKQLEHLLVSIPAGSKTFPIQNSIKSDVSSTTMKRKLIVIGSLYANAGSTFTALSLARVLDQNFIPHALVESISNEPELYALLYGERHAPNYYSFTADRIYQGGMEKAKIWQNGNTEWHPLPPTGFQGNWQTEHTYKLLYSITQPIVLLDVSHYWEHPIVKEICLQADEIVVVAGPSLSKLKFPSTLDHLNCLLDLQLQGKSIQWIANRKAAFSAEKEWLAALPFTPICTIPELVYADMLKAQWSGKLIQDRDPYLHILTDCLKPLMNKIIPETYFTQADSKKKHFLSRWFN
ncbi:MAG: putative serine/threonine-protein kinase [Bacilli bacterium]|nr:putative serine/threonine-protein kinase [Bacilli bacterium]